MIRFITAAWNVITITRRFIGNLVFLIVAILLVAWFWVRDDSKLPEQAVLVLSPSGSIVEQRTESLLPDELFGQDLMTETLLKDVIDAIEHARQDLRVKGLFLELGKLHAVNLSNLQQIASAIIRFRESGKPVIAASDFFTQRKYYLAAHADRVYLHPLGGVLLTGFGIYHNYFKTALDRLLVHVHIFKAGNYKSALEPLTRTDMSEFDRKANSDLLDVLWASYKADIAGQRKIEPASIDDYINHFPSRLADREGDAARLALDYGLVDGLKTQDEVRDELAALAGVDPADQSYNRVGFDDYIRTVRLPEPRRNRSGPKVGVITAQGIILDGNQSAGKIGSESLSKLLRQAAQDKAVRALVLRIDSPGGSAFASDEIRRELELVRSSGKPVVVSMGSAAASGGYWIASAADEIWASPTTLTGSIGVFGAFPTFEGSLEAVGIRNDGLGTTRLADAFNPNRPMNPLVADAMNQIVERVYRTFVQRVAAGRKMTPEKVEEVAQGRIWAGTDAQAIGLVDRLGELRGAIESAAKMAGLDQFTIDYIEQPLTGRERLLRQLKNWMLVLARSLLGTMSPQAGHVLGWLGDPPIRDVLQLNDPRGVYAYCLECGVF